MVKCPSEVPDGTGSCFFKNGKNIQESQPQNIDNHRDHQRCRTVINIPKPSRKSPTK